jgi:hypothetical protein
MRNFDFLCAAMIRATAHSRCLVCPFPWLVAPFWIRHTIFCSVFTVFRVERISCFMYFLIYMMIFQNASPVYNESHLFNYIVVRDTWTEYSVFEELLFYTCFEHTLQMLTLAFSFFALFCGEVVYANVDLPVNHNTASVTKERKKRKKKTKSCSDLQDSLKTMNSCVVLGMFLRLSC